jgi:tetratricopeptide (TPR) repeat protein
MNMQEAFDQGDFLGVADSASLASTPEEKLLVAVAMLKIGRVTEALDSFRDISDQVKKLSKAFLYMAQIHRDRKEPETAKFCIERYAVFYPDDDEALAILQDQEEEPASLVDDDSPELAGVYAAQGHFEQALDIYVNILRKGVVDQETEKEARKVQTMYIIKTLEGWLERLRA